MPDKITSVVEVSKRLYKVNPACGLVSSLASSKPKFDHRHRGRDPSIALVARVLAGSAHVAIALPVRLRYDLHQPYNTALAHYGILVTFHTEHHIFILSILS